MAHIRRYKAFIVLFFVLVLVVYAKQATGTGITYELSNTHNHYFISASSFSTSNYSPTHTERFTVYSVLFKKIVFEKISFRQFAFSLVGLINSNNSSVNLPYASISTFLEQICVLRI